MAVVFVKMILVKATRVTSHLKVLTMLLIKSKYSPLTGLLAALQSGSSQPVAVRWTFSLPPTSNSITFYTGQTYLTHVLTVYMPPTPTTNDLSMPHWNPPRLRHPALTDKRIFSLVDRSQSTSTSVMAPAQNRHHRGKASVNATKLCPNGNARRTERDVSDRIFDDLCRLRNQMNI